MTAAFSWEENSRLRTALRGYELATVRLIRENSRLRIALRGYETEPVSPFPLLSGEEILRILHPDRRRGDAW